MVRLKHRYILFEILYPPSAYGTSREQKEKFSEFSQTPKDALLHMHSPSPSAVSPRSILLLLKRVIVDHYGEFASGTVGSLIIVKYFSNRTSTGILRCSRNDFHIVVAALALIDKIETHRVVVRSVHVSGTIRKCEDFSIRRARKLMADLGKEDEVERGLDEFISMFKSGDREDDDE
ncbi:hypothetical protein METBIDRAFT_39205 [Metschnikowia bicuspidata var. bicuspidata NRRL YB-4993]|uniref:Ribonuclease P/MRP protein subunit POP5 n=1 Tax=Metschnikowia bicuspidata var. bicuspidata NRRL YB-4993 TaxID=869754 RepID=A0A1A0HCL6_9ASCO|nr:hypothetical protein METBIDRAFT_39205 [Metschnikowia bicuspidata var. bicuspidata NRRL YB-4993]OBA21849.1 hypothetical protein METBIDRAFT_39205 [Metschnikowia bicuspidata var. bicuspidata NRRL YB-4993]